MRFDLQLTSLYREAQPEVLIASDVLPMRGTHVRQLEQHQGSGLPIISSSVNSALHQRVNFFLRYEMGLVFATPSGRCLASGGVGLCGGARPSLCRAR